MMRESFYIEPVEVERSVFVAGQAYCRRCHAPVRRSQIAPLALIRQVFGEDADAGWCTACGETTYFLLI
jgi:hypothetical protein